MQRGRVINFKGYNFIFDFVKQNKVLILLVAFYFGGLIFGVFSYGKLSFLGLDIRKILECYINSRNDLDFLKIASNSFFTSLLYLLVCYIFGSSLFGGVILPFYIGLWGYLYGQLTAFLYAVFSFKGIAFHTVIILPSAVLLTIALIMSAREALIFSFALARLTLPASMPKNLFYDFKLYSTKFLILSSLCIISSIVDGIISCNLLDKISIF